MKNQAPSRETIAERAYSLWEQAGQPTGRDEEFWLRAEAELASLESSSASPPLSSPPISRLPQTPTALAVHQIPPVIKDAVKISDRRPARPRVPKRA